MSSREIKDFSALIVNGIRFAEGRDSVAGRLPVTAMPRLLEMLSDSESWLDCELSGRDLSEDLAASRSSREVAGLKRAGLGPGIHLKVSGQLQLPCQRCLAGVAYECRIDTLLLLVPPGCDWPSDELETDAFDAIAAGDEMSVVALIEEEILLDLPLITRHDNCRLPQQTVATAETADKEKQPSPFAALAALKKH